ncbi:MAG: hypothetical protein R2751_19645 [Bacteroidales bacterium]
MDGIEAAVAETGRPRPASTSPSDRSAGKMVGQPLYRLWGLNPATTPMTSFTIGIDTPDVVREKTREAPFKVLKVKLGGGNDREMIETVRSVTDVPVYVDVNQGWTDRQLASTWPTTWPNRGWNSSSSPCPRTGKRHLPDSAHSPLPVIADEAFQRLPDVPTFKGSIRASTSNS